MFPHTTTTLITNALLSSTIPPSPPLPLPPQPPDLFFFAALSLLFLFKTPFFSSPSSPPPPPSLSFLLSPRCRRLKPTKMRPQTPTITPPPLTFSSPDSLAEWLKPRLPSDSLAFWGVTPGTKTVHNLWLELSQGETSLLLHHQEEQEQEEGSSLPLRTVHVATVRIRNHAGALLVESHQLLSDGTIRHRFRPLSEKMKPGESVEEAALRAVREELGGGTVKIVPGSVGTRVEERASASYPGLPARYVLHTVDAQVEGLPEEGEFSTEETGESVEAQEKVIFVMRHFWKWVDDDGSFSNLGP